MRFKLLGTVALTAGALAFSVTPAFAATSSPAPHGSTWGQGGNDKGGQGGDQGNKGGGNNNGGKGGSKGDGGKGGGSDNKGGGSNDGKGYTLTGCSWDQQYTTNHDNCYAPKPEPKPAPKPQNYWEQDWNLSWGQHNGYRYPVITESWGWSTHPVCLTEDITFDFPHGTNVLTEVSGPALHNGELAVYGGHDYVIENVHGSHFSVESAGSWSLLTNTGNSIWDGHAELPCLSI